MSLGVRTKTKRKIDKKVAKKAEERFKSFKEVDLKFYLSNNMRDIQKKKAAVTHDYDFMRVNKND